MINMSTTDLIRDISKAVQQDIAPLIAKIEAFEHRTENLESPIAPTQNLPFPQEDTEMAKYKERVEVGRTEDGTAVYKWVEGNTKQEVLRKVASLICGQGMSTAPLAPEPVYFKPYAMKWMQLYKAGKKKHTTESEYRSILNKHLYPAFGERDIRSITIDEVQEFMDSKVDYAAKTIQEMKMVLGMILEAAREDGVIPMNPARSSRLTNPSKKAMKRSAISPEAAADIIGQLDGLAQDRDRFFLAILLFTGMRRGEVIGLRWEDIDFQGGVISVRRGVTYKGNRPVVDTTKTEAGIRCVQLNSLLAKQLSPRKETGYIVGDGEEPVTQQIVKGMWRRIKKSINVYETTPHYFRHTFVTFARRAGIEDKTLKTIGGWKDLATLQNIYSHTQDADIAVASARMENMFPTG